MAFANGRPLKPRDSATVPFTQAGILPHLPGTSTPSSGLALHLWPTSQVSRKGAGTKTGPDPGLLSASVKVMGTPTKGSWPAGTVHRRPIPGSWLQHWPRQQAEFRGACWPWAAHSSCWAPGRASLQLSYGEQFGPGQKTLSVHSYSE